MNDWNPYREQLTLRIREFSRFAPETMSGIVSLGQAGEKTNHLDAKTRERVSPFHVSILELLLCTDRGTQQVRRDEFN